MHIRIKLPCALLPGVFVQLLQTIARSKRTFSEEHVITFEF